MPYSLTFVCSLPFSTVIVSPSDIFTTLAGKAKRGQAITRIAKGLKAVTLLPISKMILEILKQCSTVF